MKGIQRWPVALMIIGISLLQTCSIIEDSDIQSQEDLDTKLRLSGIKITESAGFGSNLANVILNANRQASLIEWVVPDGNMGITTGGSTTLKFNFLHDLNAERPLAYSTNITYNSSGYPSKIANVATLLPSDNNYNFEFESWEYTYTSSNMVATIITKRISQDGGYNVKITDELIYLNEKVSQVNRVVEDLITSAITNETIHIKTRYSDQEIKDIEYEYANGLTRLYLQQCNNVKDYYCYFSQIEQPNDGASGNPQVIFTFSGVLQSLQLVDQRRNGDEIFNQEINRAPDIFFIHPLLLLSDLFVDGIDISQIYIHDWWQASAVYDDQFPIETNESISIEYVYSVDQ